MIFLDRGFLTEFLRVSYTCSSAYSVYTYTHLLHAHFSVAQIVCAHPHTSLACAHRRMAQVHENGICHMSVFVRRLQSRVLDHDDHSFL